MMFSSVRVFIVGNICTRFMSNNRMQLRREARMLDKMISKKMSQRKTVNSGPRKLKQEFLASAYDNESTNRKIASLNKFYMEQLIELINCGPFSSQLTELGIEFTKVKLTSCRSSIAVYWIAHKPEIPESALSKVLEALRKDLQAQVGLLKSMRTIPYINFARDFRMERQNIVEKLLEVADFGKDIHPESAHKVVKADSSEIQKMENAGHLKMRQNVFGLDHAKITEALVQRVKKFNSINIKKNELEEIKQYEHPEKLATFSKNLFTRFYRRKVYLEKKFRQREYDDSFIVFEKPYDPEEEANKHWEFLQFKDDLMVEEQELEMQKFKNLQGIDTGEEDDDNVDDDYYSEEREVETHTEDGSSDDAAKN